MTRDVPVIKSEEGWQACPFAVWRASLPSQLMLFEIASDQNEGGLQFSVFFKGFPLSTCKYLFNKISRGLADTRQLLLSTTNNDSSWQCSTVL
jgi:hypothetical protein